MLPEPPLTPEQERLRQSCLLAAARALNDIREIFAAEDAALEAS